MGILAYLCSILSFASSVSSGMIKGKSKKQFGFMLILTFFSNLFAGLGYLFNAAGINGAMSCALGCIVAVVNYFYRVGNKSIPKVVLGFYYIGFFVINIINRNTFILTTIAILATFSFVVNLSQKDGKKFRLWKMVNNFLWLSYDIISKSYNQIPLHVAIIVFTGLSSLYYDRKREN